MKTFIAFLLACVSASAGILDQPAPNLAVSNSYNGSFIGNGSGLSNIVATSTNPLPSNVLTQYQANVTLGGTFGGDGGGLTNFSRYQSFGGDTNLVWSFRVGNDIYAQTPWTNSTALQFYFQATNATTMMPKILSVGVVLTNSHTDTNLVTPIGDASDDMPPILTQWGYISGNHGWNMVLVTLASHGCAVGDIIADAAGLSFAVIKVVSSSQFFIAARDSNPMALLTGLATNVSTTTPLTGYSQGLSQVLPCISSATTWWKLDNQPVSSLAAGREFELGYTVVFPDPRGYYYAATNNPAFTPANGSALFERTLRMKIFANGQLTAEDDITSLSSNAWVITYAGGMQMLGDQFSGMTWFVPNCNYTEAGIDFSMPFMANSLASNVTLRSSFNWDKGFRLDSMFMSHTSQWGQLLTYDPWDGEVSHTNRFWLLGAGSQKIYPEAIGGKTLTLGTHYRIVAHRKFFPWRGEYITDIWRPNKTPLSYVVGASLQRTNVVVATAGIISTNGIVAIYPATDAVNTLRVFTTNSTTPILTISSNRVGIGKAPSGALDVLGTILGTSFYSASGYFYAGGTDDVSAGSPSIKSLGGLNVAKQGLFGSNVTALSFIGNGSGLTNLNGGTVTGTVATATTADYVRAQSLTNQVSPTLANGTMTPNFLLPYSFVSTNSGFSFGQPLNVSATLHQTAVIYVTNSTGSAIACGPPNACHSQGTWYITNVTAFTFVNAAGRFTNAVAFPLW